MSAVVQRGHVPALALHVLDLATLDRDLAADSLDTGGEVLVGVDLLVDVHLLLDDRRTVARTHLIDSGMVVAAVPALDSTLSRLAVVLSRRHDGHVLLLGDGGVAVVDGETALLGGDVRQAAHEGAGIALLEPLEGQEGAVQISVHVGDVVLLLDEVRVHVALLGGVGIAVLALLPAAVVADALIEPVLDGEDGVVEVVAGLVAVHGVVLLGDGGGQEGVGQTDGLARLEQVEVASAHGGSGSLRVVSEVGIAAIDTDQSNVLTLARAVSTGRVVDGSAHRIGGEGNVGHGVLSLV